MYYNEDLVFIYRCFYETLNTLESTFKIRDTYTTGHQKRVSQLACAIVEKMGIPFKGLVDGVRIGALIHDIGKIHMPFKILNKPKKLTKNEFNVIKTHPQFGYDLLKNIEFPWPIAKIAFQHHERLNGSGYPQGLSGDNIILEARIVAVADVVEVMISPRPYRVTPGIDMALENISQNKDVLYDSLVVNACLRLFTEKGFRLDN